MRSEEKLGINVKELDGRLRGQRNREDDGEIEEKISMVN